MSPDGEFCCRHLVFGVFCPQIHVFWGPITNFRKWGLLIASNPHFRKFVNMVGTLSAEGGRRQLANFRKWGLLAISNPHFRKFASCHCTSIRVNFSTSEAEVFSSMCLVRRAGHLFFIWHGPKLNCLGYTRQLQIVFLVFWVWRTFALFIYVSKQEGGGEVAHSCTRFPCYLGMEINEQSTQTTFCRQLSPKMGD